MKKFIGRKDEIYVLDKAYKSEVSEFIPIYGRRRVGKSELIKRKQGFILSAKKHVPIFKLKNF
jgi:hypothetical protein